LFVIEIAGLKISIENRYDFVKTVCKNYIIDCVDFDFSVSVLDNDLERERELSGGRFSDGFIESVCIYRCIARELPKYDAFVMHCAAIEHDGAAYCFAAKSGVGKTTHITIWKKIFGDRVNIINGDKPIFRFIGDEIYVCGTPWGGKEGLHSNTRASLGSICFIERAENNKIQQIDSLSALNRILPQVFIPYDNEKKIKTVDMVAKILKDTPIFNLECNVSDEAAKVAFEAMTKKR
jgi:hypothetical protein